MNRTTFSSPEADCPSRRLLVVAALICLSLVPIMWHALKTQAMDVARSETRTDLAASTFGVSGRGVIVAVLDRGIDWKNSDFRNDDGTTRIKYIFDLTDNTGANAPGNIYGRGTIYTEAQINTALTGGPALATRDAVGHGTTTAGIATGNGRNSTNQKYRGIAPKATIIVVKVTSDGAPAHDSELAEAVFNDANAYPVAIDFVRDKAKQLGMPAVMLLNLGSPQGPTDGTSSLARKIDTTVGPGKPGIVFVNGTGDDGGMPNRAGGVVPQNGTASIQIQKGVASTLRFDLWYGGDDRFDVSLQTPSGNFGPFASPPTNNDQSSVQNATFAYSHQGANLDFFGATNGKREVLIDIAGPVGTYTIQLQGSSVTNGRFDATLNPSNIGQQPASQSNRFLNFVVPGSIWDGATAHNNICPNDYVVRTNFTDIDGIPRSTAGQGSIGDLWQGTSVGPTFDGRLGVDVSAPGDSVFTAYAPTSYWATFRFNKIQDGNGFYGRASATSAAAPIVTGIIALMLEKDPQLDAAQVKSLLQHSARRDSSTGLTLNPNWGYGKVDAYGAVQLAALPGNPADDAQFYVRQHYLDFLNREPDPSGVNFWTNEITSCGNNQGCIEVKRINVSASFFLAIEFQQTGYLVERIYKAAYGNAAGTSTFGGAHQLVVPIIRLNEFLSDTQEIGQGVIVLQTGWEQALENNKQAFTADFVQRSRFTNAFPATMTPAQFVDTLNTNAGNPLSIAERNQLVSDLSTNAKTRAQVLRAVAEDPDLSTAEFNRAFVLMQYFGYLRRNPNDPQDTDYTGYDFWLTKLNQFNGNYNNAEMVKAFLSSIEYRQRFGP